MYSTDFDRDFSWYLKMRKKFNFDGSSHYFNKKGEDIIVYDKKGVTGKEAFFKWDSTGKILATKHPNILYTLLKTKGSVNLHIKMFAQDRANGLFPLIEFRAFCIKYKCPAWFKDAVEKQKNKHYKRTGDEFEATVNNIDAFGKEGIIRTVSNILTYAKNVG